MLNFSSKSQSDLVALSEFSDTCIGAKRGFNRWFTVGKIMITKFCCLGPLWSFIFHCEAVFEVMTLHVCRWYDNYTSPLAILRENVPFFGGPGEFQWPELKMVGIVTSNEKGDEVWSRIESPAPKSWRNSRPEMATATGHRNQWISSQGFDLGYQHGSESWAHSDWQFPKKWCFQRCLMNTDMTCSMYIILAIS